MCFHEGEVLLNTEYSGQNLTLKSTGIVLEMSLEARRQDKSNLQDISLFLSLLEC